MSGFRTKEVALSEFKHISRNEYHASVNVKKLEKDSVEYDACNCSGVKQSNG